MPDLDTDDVRARHYACDCWHPVGQSCIEKMIIKLESA